MALQYTLRRYSSPTGPSYLLNIDHTFLAITRTHAANLFSVAAEKLLVKRQDTAHMRNIVFEISLAIRRTVLMWIPVTVSVI